MVRQTNMELSHWSVQLDRQGWNGKVKPIQLLLTPKEILHFYRSLDEEVRKLENKVNQI